MHWLLKFVFGIKLYVSDSSSVHHEFFTVHTAMLYVIQVCWRLVSRIRTELAEPNQFRPDTASKLSANLYDIHHRCVYSKKKLLMMDRGTVRNVKFYSKNKFEKSVHLVGFIVRIYGRVKTRNALGTNKEFVLSLKDINGRRLIAGLPTRRPAFRPFLSIWDFYWTECH